MNEDLRFTQVHKPAFYEKDGSCRTCWGHYCSVVEWLGQYEDNFRLNYFKRFHDGGHQ